MIQRVVRWPRSAGECVIRSLTKVAVGLLVLAAVFALLWGLHVRSWIDSLAPNVITESLGIALALTVIDRIVRRRDRERVLPIVTYTLDNIDLGLTLLAQTLAIDFAQSHRAVQKPPESVLGLIRFWLENDPLADAPRRIGDQGICRPRVPPRRVSEHPPAGTVAVEKPWEKRGPGFTCHRSRDALPWSSGPRLQAPIGARLSPQVRHSQPRVVAGP